MDASFIITSNLSIIFGILSFILVCAYAIPQFITVLKTKNTSGVPIFVYIAFVFSSSAMFAFALGNSYKISEQIGPENISWARCILMTLPALLLNALNITLNFICLILKIKHIKLSKKLNISEFELANYLLGLKAKGSDHYENKLK